jgi:GGDEF domain-containing protein
MTPDAPAARGSPPPVAGLLLAGSPAGMLGVGVAAVAGTLSTGPVAHLPTRAAPLHVPWWGLALLFALAEICAHHVQVGRDAHSFSLNEIPLVLGLTFDAPGLLVTAQLCGAAVALVLHRRQPPHKLLFNCGNLALSTSLAALAFGRALGGRPPVTPLGWLASLSAAETASLSGAALVCVAMLVSRSPLGAGEVVRQMGKAVVTTVAVTSVALVMVTVLWFQPLAIVMLAIPLAVLFAAYRGYNTHHNEARDLEFLYEASKMVNQAPEITSAVRTLLARAVTMFRADVAEFVLLPAEGEEVAYRAAIGGDVPGDTMCPVALSALDEALVDQFAAAQALLVRAGHPDRVLSRCLESRGLKDAMLVCLRGEVRIIGYMLLGNRTGRLNSFTSADLRLLHALATQAGTALENGRLERSVTRLLSLEQELRYRAYHDQQTGLPNRALFLEKLSASLRAGRPGTGFPSLVLVRVLALDPPSLEIADEAQLVLAVAGRIRGVVRGQETVARVAAASFAILLEESSPLAGPAVAERVRAALQHPFGVEGRRQEVLLTASVEVVTDVASHGRADDVLARAEAGARHRVPADRARPGLLARIGGGDDGGVAAELRSSIAGLRAEVAAGRRCA